MGDENKKQEGYARQDWEKHYESGDMGWDLGSVAPPFKRLWDEKQILPGKTIVPGCGRGHEVLFLAEKGFQVTAVDFASGAVKALERSLAGKDLDCEVIHNNFFKLGSGHDESYDLILEHTFFCAIAPSQRPLYVDTVHRILKRRGLLAGLFYETGEQGGPPFNTTREDILNHFSRSFDIKILEKTPHSAEQRKDKEWLGVFRKK